ncbi:MAG: hypothetical protein K8R92_12165 [Planctomycetes bacterium]|nr:hypothetical protein [Planctomycetota bacterium]
MSEAIDIDSASLASILQEAVRAGADAVHAAGSPKAIQKSDSSPVTLADFAGQCAITESLVRRLGSAIRIAGEESADETGAAGEEETLHGVTEVLNRADTKMQWTIERVRSTLAMSRDAGGAVGSLWTIDPIDGTKGYLRGGQFAIAVGLLVDGAPFAGAIGCPRLGLSSAAADSQGTLAFAIRGRGAWQVPLKGAAAPTQMRARSWSPGGAIRLAESVEAAHSAHDRALAMISPAGSVTCLPMDSQAKYVLLARGDADCFVRLSPKPDYGEKIWDHAAGVVIAQEAGCAASDASGAPLDFRRGRSMHPGAGVFCAHPALHSAVLGGRPQRPAGGTS